MNLSAKPILTALGLLIALSGCGQEADTTYHGKSLTLDDRYSREISFDIIGATIPIKEENVYVRIDDPVADMDVHQRALFRDLGVSSTRIIYGNPAEKGRHVHLAFADGKECSFIWVLKDPDVRISKMRAEHEKYHALCSIWPQDIRLLSEKINEKGFDVDLRAYDEELAATIVEILSLHLQGVPLNRIWGSGLTEQARDILIAGSAEQVAAVARSGEDLAGLPGVRLQDLEAAGVVTVSTDEHSGPRYEAFTSVDIDVESAVVTLPTLEEGRPEAWVSGRIDGATDVPVVLDTGSRFNFLTSAYLIEKGMLPFYPYPGTDASTPAIGLSMPTTLSISGATVTRPLIVCLPYRTRTGSTREEENWIGAGLPVLRGFKYVEIDNPAGTATLSLEPFQPGDLTWDSAALEFVSSATGGEILAAVIEINGATVRCRVDTGSRAAMMVNASAWARCEAGRTVVARQATTRRCPQFGAIPCQALTIDGLCIGPVALDGQTVYLFEDRDWPFSMPSIGMMPFAHRRLVLDFATMTLWTEASGS